jgi:hypothetical protein
MSVNNWPSNFDWKVPTQLNWANTGARRQAFSMVGFDDGNNVVSIFRNLDRNANSFTIDPSSRQAWVCHIRVDAMNYVDRNDFVFVGTSSSWKFYQNIFQSLPDLPF